MRATWLLLLLSCALLHGAPLQAHARRPHSTTRPPTPQTAISLNDVDSVVFGTNFNYGVQFLRARTFLIVPPKPPPNGTVFVWMGLTPGELNFLPINLGVLQSVLTWGPSCAPGNQPAAYSTWWISAQYVNTYGAVPGHMYCNGGPIMAARPGDVLQLDMYKVHRSPVWRQIVRNVKTRAQVTYSINMQDQYQNTLWFRIELYDGAVPPLVKFANTSFSISKWDKNACFVRERGPCDVVGPLRLTRDACLAPSIVLNREGANCTL